MKNSRFLSLNKVLNITTRSLNSSDTLHNDYVSNYIKVCEYVAAVNKSSLPALLVPVPHWDEYTKCLVDAKTAALKWTNEVAANLKALPDDIIAENGRVISLFNDAIDKCDKLIKDPTDKYYQDKLAKDLEHSADEIKGLCDEMKSVIDILHSFNDTLPAQAKNLQRIADLAMEDEKVDKAKIEELKKLISDANNEVASLSLAIAGLSIAIGAAVAISIVAVACAGPWGMATWIFTGAAIAAATTFIVLDGMKITELKQLIEANQKSMDNYTADVAALQLTAQIFSDLANQSKLIEDNMKYILSAWTALSVDLKAIGAEINEAQGNFDKSAWESVKTDFVSASSLWNAFIEKVKVLSLDNIDGNTCQLKLGMSQDQVKAAMDKGTEMDIIKYLTA